jgi:uncharacterized protein
MISLQRLLGKDDRFNTLLEASAREARASVQVLVKLLKESDHSKSLDEFIQARRRDKSITQEIRDALCTTFVTALEREDIEALAVAIYKIPKTVEKIAERILLAPRLLNGVDLSKELVLLEKASDLVVTLIQELRKGIHLERVKGLNDQLQTIEGEADKMLVELLGQLYRRQCDTVQIVFLKDLFELLEKIADRCRDAGNLVNHIVLKNS